VIDNLPFREAVTGDFEFRIAPGDLPKIACAVFRELRSGRELRFWRDELLCMRKLPFDERDVFVGFYTSAEIGCFLQLGLEPPCHVVDLFAEHRCLTNGMQLPRARLKTTSQSGKTHKSSGRDTQRPPDRGRASISSGNESTGHRDPIPVADRLVHHAGVL
jgi:hypothetical protein